MSDWWSRDPLVQAGTKVAEVVANPEQWWAADPINQPGMVSSAVRGAAQGLTLGAGDEGSAVAAASPVPGAEQRARVLPLPDPIDMILGGGRMLLEKTGLTGSGGGEAYDRALTQKRADNKQHREANPISYGAGEIVGGTVPVVAAAAAAPAAFGVTGSLGARSAMSAASGGGIGTIQGLLSGEGGAESRALEAGKGFLGGAAIGAVAPALGQLAGAGYRKVADALINRTASVPGYANAAVQRVADALEAQRALNPNMQADMARFGPEAMLLDSGDAMKGLAQGIATRPGEARARVVEALTERQAGRNGRIGVDLDEGLGRAVVPSQVEADLAAGRQAVGDAYPAVLRDARAVDTRQLADQLETMMVDLRGDPRRAVQNVRQMLNIPGQQVLDPSPRAVLNIRHAIDGLMESEKDSAVLSQLGFARQAIDDYLRGAVPGIKPVDARFQELARQSEGLKRGSSILDSGKEALRPEEMAASIRAGAEPDGMFIGPSAETFRMRQGTRAEIDRLIGTKSNDYLAVRDAVKGEGDWNRAKLTQLFGEERAAKIVNSLDREAAFEEVYRDVVRNSMTAQRLAGKEMVAVREGSGSGAGNTALVGVVGGPTGIAAQGAIKGARAAKGVLDTAADEARNSDIARMLVTRGPEMDAIFDVLSRNARGRKSAEAGSAATERIVQALLKSRGYDLGALSAPYAQRVARSAFALIAALQIEAERVKSPDPAENEEHVAPDRPFLRSVAVPVAKRRRHEGGDQQHAADEDHGGDQERNEAGDRWGHGGGHIMTKGEFREARAAGDVEVTGADWVPATAAEGSTPQLVSGCHPVRSETYRLLMVGRPKRIWALSRVSPDLRHRPAEPLSVSHLPPLPLGLGVAILWECLKSTAGLAISRLRGKARP